MVQRKSNKNKTILVYLLPNSSHQERNTDHWLNLHALSVYLYPTDDVACSDPAFHNHANSGREESVTPICLQESKINTLFVKKKTKTKRERERERKQAQNIEIRRRRKTTVPRFSTKPRINVYFLLIYVEEI